MVTDRGVYDRYPDAAPGTVKHPLEHPTLIELAAVHRKTPAQIALRWHLDRGRAAVPRSVRPERIADNIDVFDFALREDELAAIDRMDTGVRAGADPEVASAPTLHVRTGPA